MQISLQRLLCGSNEKAT